MECDTANQQPCWNLLRIKFVFRRGTERAAPRSTSKRCHNHQPRQRRLPLHREQPPHRCLHRRRGVPHLAEVGRRDLEPNHIGQISRSLSNTAQRPANTSHPPRRRRSTSTTPSRNLRTRSASRSRACSLTPSVTAACVLATWARWTLLSPILGWKRFARSSMR